MLDQPFGDPLDKEQQKHRADCLCEIKRGMAEEGYDVTFREQGTIYYVRCDVLSVGPFFWDRDPSEVVAVVLEEFTKGQ